MIVVHAVLQSRFDAAMTEVAGLEQLLRAPPRAIRVPEEQFD